jgi:hypothetical protein
MISHSHPWIFHRPDGSTLCLGVFLCLSLVVGCGSSATGLTGPKGADRSGVVEDRRPGRVDLPPGWRMIPGAVRVDVPPGTVEFLSPGVFPDVVMALARDPGGGVWVGTSTGRLFRLQRDGSPVLIAHLKHLRINALASARRDRIWAATADGLRCVALRQDGDWAVEEHRYCYIGEPVFVSAAYVPEDYTDRLFGEVADVVAWRDGDSEHVVAISAAHGAFEYLQHHRVWQWFERCYGESCFYTESLFPHGRPLCGFRGEDECLWIGTMWDGIARLPVPRKASAAARAKEPLPVRAFAPDEVGPGVRHIHLIARSEHAQRIWCVAEGEDGPLLARFDAGEWAVQRPVFYRKREIESPAYYMPFFPVFAAAEVATDRVWLATRDGIFEHDWVSGKTHWVEGIEGEFRALLRLPDGTVFVGGSDLLVHEPHARTSSP